MIMRRAAVAGAMAGAICCALATAACSGPAPGPAAGPRTGPVPSSLAEAEARLPLASYQGSAAVNELALKAQFALVADCLAGRGVRNFAAPSPGAPAVVDQGGPYGYIDARRAASLAFTSPAGPAYSLPSRRAAEAFKACWRRMIAQAARTGLLAGNSYLLSGLEQEADAETADDPWVMAATGRWASCMASAGFGSTTPQQLVYRFASSGPRPSALARRAAEADVRCTVRSGLSAAYFAVLGWYQARLVRRHEPALAELRRDNQALPGRAARIIGHRS